jgi:hypothetical protein
VLALVARAVIVTELAWAEWETFTLGGPVGCGCVCGRGTPGSQSHCRQEQPELHCWTHLQVPDVLFKVTVLVSPSTHSAPHLPLSQLNVYWSGLHLQSMSQNPDWSRIPYNLPSHVVCACEQRWLLFVYGVSHCSPLSTTPSPHPEQRTEIFFSCGCTGLHLSLFRT